MVCSIVPRTYSGSIFARRFENRWKILRNLKNLINRKPPPESRMEYIHPSAESGCFFDYSASLRFSSKMLSSMRSR